MGFETLKNIIEANKEQAILDEQETMYPVICPYCIWTLDINSKNEKSCKICGRIYK